MNRERSFNIIRTAVSMLVAILVAFFIILLVSDQPVESIKTFLLAPFSSKRYLGNIVETAVPLIFSGLAMAVMFKASLFNLGGEGVFFISGIAGSFLAIWLKMPPIVFPIACIAAGALAGMVIMLVPGVLKAKYGANEMVTSLMMNNILLGVGLYLLNNVMRDPKVASLVSYKYRSNALLSNIVPGTRIHSGFLIAVLCAVLVYLFMFKSKWGYEIRMTGNNPLGVIGAAFFVSYLRIGADLVNRSSDIPTEMIAILQSIIILLISAERFLHKYKQNWIEKEVKG